MAALVPDSDRRRSTPGCRARKCAIERGSSRMGDKGNRAATTLEGLASLKPVIDGGVVTAGHASPLSDGASPRVIMEAGLAPRPDAPGGLSGHGRGGPV